MIWICATGSMGGQFLELVINQQNLEDANPAEFYKVLQQDGFFGKWIEILKGEKLVGNIKSLTGTQRIDQYRRKEMAALNFRKLKNGFVKKEFDIRRECLLDNNLIAGFTHCINDHALDDYAKENGDIVLQVLPGPYIVHFVKRESSSASNVTDAGALARRLFGIHLHYSRSFNLYHKNNRIIFPQQCFMENPKALSSLIPNFDEDLFRSNRDYYKEQNYADIKNQDIINEVLNIFNNLIIA